MGKGLLIPLSLATCGCATVSSPLPRGEEAYKVIPAPLAGAGQREYVIAPLDTISVLVFQEPELSIQNIQVDGSGNISFPLLGSMQAAGRTAPDLSAELARGLDRYLVKPQVTVSVASATSRVAVEGSVQQPGVFEIRGSTSLVEALALARSPTRAAALDQVIVFRNIDGERMGARFDLRRIRAGIDPDPEIFGGDRIVVGSSGWRGIWLDLLSASPLLNIFTRL
jgi:polysaccharide export outer membrane protein